MRDARANTLVIHTPEGISFSLPLAGPATRFFAWGIDFACILTGVLVISRLAAILAFLTPGLGQAFTILLYFGTPIAYGILTEWYWRGQTLGKRLLGLRVMDEQGLRLRFSQVAIRNLLRFVDSMPVLYLVGGMACLLSTRSQRLGDYAANTIVVRTRTSPALDIEQAASGKYNSFRGHPRIEARLRQGASSEEAALAFEALLRREELEPLARVELYREIADHFRALATFPEEATFCLTDEQYLRNIVDSLFQTRSG